VPPVANALTGTLWLVVIVTGVLGSAVTSNILSTVICAVVAVFDVMPSFAVNLNVQSLVAADGVYVNELPVPEVAIPGQLFAVHE
jgi:hypothetical protein